MTSQIPVSPEPEPGPVDWDALNNEVFGDPTPDVVNETAEQVAPAMGPAEAARQFTEWNRADELVRRMKVHGADRASIARALHAAYPEVRLPGYETPDELPMLTAPPVPAEEAPGPRPLSLGMWIVVSVVIGAVAALAMLGFIISFGTQVDELEPFFGSGAWMIPVGIDVGIVAFAALNLVLARIDISMPWLRAVPAVLTAATLYINVNAHDEPLARIAHVVLPGLWVIASEVGTHVVKVRAGLAAGTRTESLGIARWVLSPVTTARLWRHMRLWGVRTAEAAREVESTRLEAKAALRFRYGAFWRLTAPVQLRTAYQLRRLSDAEVYTFVPPQVADTEPVKAPAAAPAASKTPARQAPVKAVKRRPGPTSPRLDDAAALERLKAIAPDEGGHLSIKRARAELGCGSDRAKRLLAEAGLLAPETTD
ncbi:DUF2637 domain-containing protein [Glycomyces dulcitolivorans]|uniref:DUF2637 domain-containing protein n=1 Tax=Glycomyces dulcitolivorans TaxID=2200759 RepID=UPI000DD2F6FE|nr:DUF2637 domain-containing protein [Glycomyces dulcitolivorans]